MKINHSYYVVAVAYPRSVRADGRIQAASVEAIVKPEETRADIIDNLTHKQYGPTSRIQFIHFVSGLFVSDETETMMQEAGVLEDVA